MITRDQLVDLISQARDKDGKPFTIEDIDGGHKTSKHLLREIEVTDVIISVDERLQRLVTARIIGLIFIEHGDYEFCEIGRRWPDGKGRQVKQKHGVRENRRINEDIEMSILWGILEELGILIKKRELFQTADQRLRNLLGKTLDYESSVFYAVLTRALFREYTWRPFDYTIRDLFNALKQSENPAQLAQELLSAWNRFLFWVRFKAGMVTVVKERDGVRVYGKWFKKNT